MSARPKDDPPFFVGYLPTPRPLVLFLACTIVVMTGLGIGVGLAVVLAQQDHGDGRFRFTYRSFEGVVQALPYPVLRLPASGDEGPRTIVLAGRGKRGVQGRAGTLDGQAVQLGGVFVLREQSRLLQVGGRVKFRALEEPGLLAGWKPADDQFMGNFKIKGEIVESKCFLGAMRPGRGKVHMACAGLCVMGGIPPMFAVYRENGPNDLLLLAGPDGGPVPEELLDHISLFVELEGDVLARDDQLIFRIDPSSLRVL